MDLNRVPATEGVQVFEGREDGIECNNVLRMRELWGDESHQKLQMEF